MRGDPGVHSGAAAVAALGGYEAFIFVNAASYEQCVVGGVDL